MKFDDYFSKYLDNKQLHVKCKENLKESNIISLKFTFLLRTYGLHFANPKICFNCHKTYLTLYKIIENNFLSKLNEIITQTALTYFSLFFVRAYHNVNNNK